MKKLSSIFFLIWLSTSLTAQKNAINLDALYQPLPASLQVFKSLDTIGDKPVVMYYAIAGLNDKDLLFTSDTTAGRRLTPNGFYEKNKHPLLVVNSSFFTFTTHQNLNVVVKNGKILSYNQHSLPGKGKDTLTYRHRFQGALGITKKRKADVAWVFSDTARRYLFASQTPVPNFTDSVRNPHLKYVMKSTKNTGVESSGQKEATYQLFSKWKMKTVVGGGPVLVQKGEVHISNNAELMFAGQAINDRHPRTAMGYTADGKLVIFVCEGRSATSAGLSLTQLATVMKNLGCVEALNLDGGGSTCLLINGKETNIPSAKGEQRAIPSVFLIMEN